MLHHLTAFKKIVKCETDEGLWLEPLKEGYLHSSNESSLLRGAFENMMANL